MIRYRVRENFPKLRILRSGRYPLISHILGYNWVQTGYLCQAAPMLLKWIFPVKYKTNWSWLIIKYNIKDEIYQVKHHLVSMVRKTFFEHFGAFDIFPWKIKRFGCLQNLGMKLIVTGKGGGEGYPVFPGWTFLACLCQLGIN